MYLKRKADAFLQEWKDSKQSMMFRIVVIRLVLSSDEMIMVLL